MKICQCVGNTLVAARIVFVLLICASNDSPLSVETGLLNYELDTKNFYVNTAYFLGAINGGRFAPMVYEMPEM